MRVLGITIGVLVMISASASGQSMLGDVGRGQELARKICAGCHRVEKGQESHKASSAKAFQDIATNPARTEMSLRVFLRTPHRKMPNLILTEDDTDNVIAYIESLR